MESRMFSEELKVSNPNGIRMILLTGWIGFRLANEKHIMNVQRWKKILNGNIVTVHDAFTTTRFGDSCQLPFLSAGLTC